MAFRTKFAETIFKQKYAHEDCETWDKLSEVLIEDVCRDKLSKTEKDQMTEFHKQMKFIAGGRYLYYAGRKNKYFNNCFILIGENDTREEWASIAEKAILALTTGGGIGIDYSIFRPEGEIIHRTGGVASGPISLMKLINEIAREVKQGGSRRSALFASLNWKHKDVNKLLKVKDWSNIKIKGTNFSLNDLKKSDFDLAAPLDMTNISLNYGNDFLEELKKGIPETFRENVKYAMKSGEPGFAFNFGDKEKETGRNACTEVVSEFDSDVCNLASVNMANIDTIEEFQQVVSLTAKFLLLGTLVADLPYAKVYEVREKTRRIGVGLMGIHEWLLKRGYKYEMNDELRKWLFIYECQTEMSANQLADSLGIRRPIAYRAIAPTGTIGILAGTTTGIEPLFATAFKRRYLKGDKWVHQYVIDGTAKLLIEKYDINPENIETAISLQNDVERRIKFQADIQDYVDMGISSTINAAPYGSEFNNDSLVDKYAEIIARYAYRLRGLTIYPDGAKGGQPLTPVSYKDAINKEGQEFEEEFIDVCDLTKGGSCGV